FVYLRSSREYVCHYVGVILSCVVNAVLLVNVSGVLFCCSVFVLCFSGLQYAGWLWGSGA
ncbi:hypothetical protein ACQWG3_25530, partial [Salmonella enterica subsp. enterica serovar Infantis]